MRRLATALLSFVVGIAFAVPGIVLALWVGLAVYRVELAVGYSQWAAERLPSLAVPLLQLADYATHRESLIVAGLGAAFLCLIGFSSLRGARQMLRPADQSSGGEAQIVLKTDFPRVGRPLEGSLRLLEIPEPEQVFRLELSCRRTYVTGDQRRKQGVETPFCAEQDVQVAQTAEGWSLPFRFEVPVTAPSSDAGNFEPGEGYIWRLVFEPKDGWISFGGPEFLLTLGPAPAAELRALEAGETPEQKEAIEAMARGIWRESLLPHERAQLRSLPAEDLAMARKVAALPDKIMSTMFKWAAILLVAVPLAVMILFFAAGAIFAGGSP